MYAGGIPASRRKALLGELVRVVDSWDDEGLTDRYAQILLEKVARSQRTENFKSGSKAHHFWKNDLIFIAARIWEICRLENTAKESADEKGKR